MQGNFLFGFPVTNVLPFKQFAVPMKFFSSFRFFTRFFQTQNAVKGHRALVIRSLVQYFLCLPVLYIFAGPAFSQTNYPHYPCKAMAVKGSITADEQLVLRGEAVAQIRNIRFSTTADVLVLNDRYQRNFYVVPAQYTSADEGVSCTDWHVNCSPVVKDAFGNIVMTFADEQWTASARPEGKSETAAAPQQYSATSVPRTVYTETSVVETGSSHAKAAFKVLRFKNE